MVGVSDGVYASDQAYYYSKPVSVKDTLTGLLCYKYPETDAKYVGGPEQMLQDLLRLHALYFKTHDPEDELITSYCIAFVVTSSGKIVGARGVARKGRKQNGLERFIVDQINNNGALNNWTPAIVGGKKVNKLVTIPIVF